MGKDPVDSKGEDTLDKRMLDQCRTYLAGKEQELGAKIAQCDERAAELVNLTQQRKVAESQPWSVAEWAVAPRFDNPRATVPVLLLG